MRVTAERYREMRREDIGRLLPPRPREAHKGDCGRLLLLCGSVGFTGAARLAARAALRSGAGLVFLGVPEKIYPIVAAGLEEPVVFPLPCDEAGRLTPEALDAASPRLGQADAVLFGPGLGQSDGVRELLRRLLGAARCPVLLDADGINALAGHKDILRERRAPVVLTPHDGEFARLYEGPPLGRYGETMALARETGCTVLRKGHRTLISDGETTWRNRTGNPGMATGGSGDVLSGILTVFLADGLSPLTAAALAAYVHGAAGDRCAARLGERGMLPSDLIETLPYILKERGNKACGEGDLPY